VDLCGIPKDRFWLYKSQWKPDEVTVHILPHWNWEVPAGTKIPVFVYTNGDSAELFLNGRSMGMRSKKPGSSVSTERFRLMWNEVEYQPGELKAIAYKMGKKIGEGRLKTAGTPYRIQLTPDRGVIRADGEDLSYVLAEVFDKDGNLCPLADGKIDLSVTGPGTIAGVGNGNPQSSDPFLAPWVRFFYGKAMVIIGSGFEKGTIEVTAVSGGLEPGKATVKVE